jgi:hypothetical protein
MISDKVRPYHLERNVVLYVRKSSAHQVLHNRGTRPLQYECGIVSGHGRRRRGARGLSVCLQQPVDASAESSRAAQSTIRSALRQPTNHRLAQIQNCRVAHPRLRVPPPVECSIGHVSIRLDTNVASTASRTIAKNGGRRCKIE